ncbi:inositol-tetrakisphosphate 1-kinase 2-like [Arachis stenosperma]|uniref:inositol-tetrakisphosphate 1-kinase 2-like n=1 Tax=Arachis stenosperma TaxID=217475 RepID=UPI0025ACE65E|nr:inositol-tetrakisphosphate 1-kinase 2-like [Arachis stenosperma]
MSEIGGQSPSRYRVVFALEPKKVQSFLQNSLIDHAKNHAIELIPIDLTTAIHQQLPFHSIIHKLHSPQWTQQLRHFSLHNPSIPIIDPPDAVDRLHDRVTMLDSVPKLSLQNDVVSVSVPKQAVANDERTAIEGLDSVNLRFPVIAKPLAADGSASSHNLCLVFDREGLKSLNYPVVVQEFVNHGGAVFKIYVAGRHVTCVRRMSLADITEEEIKNLKGAVPFSQVSNVKGSREQEEEGDGVEMPPEGLVSELGRGLREALGLNLFNVDVIRDVNDEKRYLVIDINYFPGYAKLPCYETFFTNFLLDVVHGKNTV